HIPGDPFQHYLPRMEWANNDNQLMVQQFNRKQDTTWLYLVNVHNGDAKVIYTEGDSTWIDLNYFWQYDRPGWDWVDNGKKFLWTTEKDGWRHVYMMDRDGTHDHLITKGNYDVMDMAGIDREHGIIYFYASPENATQQYLYKVNLDDKGKLTRISPSDEQGTHRDDISPDGLYAIHSFSNHDTPPSTDFIRLDPYTVIKKQEGERFNKEQLVFLMHNPQTFFKVTTDDGVTMDGWMIKPANFDSTKKYPVLFYVYGEPASCTVKDVFSPNPWYQELADKGYVIISLDNRGTPAPKGRAWRHAIYRNIGILNIHDQAMGAKKIISEYPWVDTSRIAVWGWSGGGSSTQNLMFRYPDIYKT
ncbi:MAG: DPP IV N-terminal domain-containing protein, partial [Chitinophagaceae bacterium]